MYKLTKGAFSPEYLAKVDRSVRESPELGPSPLGVEFVRTMGFSIVFRRFHLPEVVGRYDFLEPFLTRAIFGASNAFYVNPLVLGVGSRVDPHADCRLLVRENVRIVPTVVSVLYARCDLEMTGGALHMNAGTDREVTLQPATNDLLHFKGSTVHSVSEVQSGGPRVSVVCEQYNLPDDVLPHFPELLVISGEASYS